MASRAKLPEGEQYEKLVGGVACYGWALGSAGAHSVGLSTFKGWVQRARAGEEPYLSWMVRFRHDLAAAKARIARVSRGDYSETAESPDELSGPS